MLSTITSALSRPSAHDSPTAVCECGREMRPPVPETCPHCSRRTMYSVAWTESDVQ